MSRLEQPFVLVVDDNVATCTLVTAILRKEFKVEIATDGLAAIDKLKSRSYAAILLDIRMPHFDGFADLDFLKTHSPDLIPRVLIFTAVGEQMLRKLEPYPVCGIIRKPFEIDELLDEVKKCAGDDGGEGHFAGVFSAGPAMLLLLADLLRTRL